MNSPKENQQKKRTVLYIEDDPASKDLMKMVASLFSHITLITAWSGEEGVKITRNEQPDLIIIDINLPLIDGVKTLQLLRPRFKDIEIIALSADVLPTSIEKGLSAGFNRYITKPVDIDILKDLFSKL